MKKRSIKVAVLVGVILGTGCVTAIGNERPSSQPPKYTITDLGLPEGGGPGYGSVAYGVNNRGMVVGTMLDRGGEQTAFLYRGESPMKRLDTMDNLRSQAWAVNREGVVVGSMATSNGTHACLWRDGKRVDIGDMGVIEHHPHYESQALGVNAHGHIVGEAGFRAFVRRDGRTELLDPPTSLKEASRMEARAINDRGQIVGNVVLAITEIHPVMAVLWTNGKAVTISQAMCHTYARAINAAGMVVGWSDDRSMAGWKDAVSSQPGSERLGMLRSGHYEVHAFVWKQDRLQDLGTLGGPQSEAYAINGSGQIVGWSSTRAGEVNTQYHDEQQIVNPDEDRRAFVYVGGKMYDLNRLIPVASGWTLVEARGINDKGQIVGTGRRKNETRAFLLTPH